MPHFSRPELLPLILIPTGEMKRKRVDNPYDTVVEILNIGLGELWKKYTQQSNEISNDLRTSLILDNSKELSATIFDILLERCKGKSRNFF